MAIAPLATLIVATLPNRERCRAARVNKLFCQAAKSADCSELRLAICSPDLDLDTVRNAIKRFPKLSELDLTHIRRIASKPFDLVALFHLVTRQGTLQRILLPPVATDLDLHHMLSAVGLSIEQRTQPHCPLFEGLVLSNTQMHDLLSSSKNPKRFLLPKIAQAELTCSDTKLLKAFLRAASSLKSLRLTTNRDGVRVLESHLSPSVEVELCLVNLEFNAAVEAVEALGTTRPSSLTVHAFGRPTLLTAGHGGQAPHDLRRLLMGREPTLLSLDLDCRPDTDLRPILSLTSLTALALRIKTTQALRVFEPLTRLKRLSLSQAFLSRADLRHLTLIHELSLFECGVQAEAHIELRQFKALRSLTLRGMTNGSINEVKAIPALERLSLLASMSQSISMSALGLFLRGQPRLRRLELSHAQFSPDALAMVGQALSPGQLRCLHIGCLVMHGYTPDELPVWFNNLECLHVTRVVGIEHMRLRARVYYE